MNTAKVGILTLSCPKMLITTAGRESNRDRDTLRTTGDELTDSVFSRLLVTSGCGKWDPT